MKPISRALALLCLLLSGTTLAAPATAYLQASQQLQQRIAQAADRGGMPRLAETETRQLLEILSDDRRFLQEPSYDASNLGELMEICGQANQAVMAYALFGLKEHLDAGAGPGDIAQQTAATLQRNAVAFQEELSYLQPFLLRCLARQIPPLSDFATALPPAEFTPVRRAGLEQMRNGLLMAYLGPLQALADDSLSLAYRSALLQVLADTSTSLASPLPVAARRQIAELASRIEADSRTALPGSQAHLQTIIAAMRDEHCSGLCAL